MRYWLYVWLAFFLPFAASAQDLSGEWAGRYVCAQGPNGVTVRLQRQGESNNYQGEFITNQIIENPNSVDSRFPFRGYFDPVTRVFRATPRPGTIRASSARFKTIMGQTIGFEAEFSGQNLMGRITDRRCGNISLAFKQGSAPSSLPQAAPISAPPRMFAGAPPTTQTQSPPLEPVEVAQDTSLNASVNEFITEDSKGWLLWRYDRGSARNARIEATDEAGTKIYGEYTFNGGRKGWVRMVVKDEKVQCIRFWNEGACRPLRRPPSHGLMSGFLEGIGRAASSPSSGSNGSSGERTCRMVYDPKCTPDGGCQHRQFRVCD